MASASARADASEAPQESSDDGGWSAIRVELPAALFGVWGRSQDEIWAVGGDLGEGRGPLVLRYDGNEWDQLETGQSSGDLWWVHGIGDVVYLGGSDGTILRYADGAFARMQTPDAEGTVFGIWAAAEDDLWAVGGRQDESGFVWRFDGTSWRPADVPEDLIAAHAVFKVWGHAADDVRLVGVRGLAIRYDGSGFERVATPTEQRLVTVHSDGDSDFLAVGGDGAGQILAEHAGRWHEVGPEGLPPLNGVAVREDWAVAVGDNGEVAVRRDGRWGLLDTGLDLARDLHAVWIDPEGGVWAVGGHVVGPPYVEGVLVHGRLTESLELAEPLQGGGCIRDGQCDDEIFCNGEEYCRDGECARAGIVECDDGVGCTSDVCDELAWACRYDAPDRDGDGHGDALCIGAQGRPAGDDCADDDASRHPAATEVCDDERKDEDCSFASVGDRDDDGDGFVSASCCNADARSTQCGNDCDDSSADVYPGAIELCDGRDNDCDSRVDEGALVPFYRDADADGWGSETAEALEDCLPPTGFVEMRSVPFLERTAFTPLLGSSR